MIVFASLKPCEMRPMKSAVLTRQPCSPAFYTSGISGFASHPFEWFAFVEFNFDVYAPLQIILVAFKQKSKLV